MNNKIMAEKLRKLRGNKSRQEVAEACGISVSALAMYEAGERVPRDEIKIKLAKFYNRSVNYIFLPIKCTFRARFKEDTHGKKNQTAQAGALQVLRDLRQYAANRRRRSHLRQLPRARR